MNEELTEEDMEALREMGYGFPTEEEKSNIFSFFKRVITMPDTTRTGNLNEEELGLARLPVRANLSLALYAKQMGLSGLGTHFDKEAHIISDSSLSKDGFLDKLAVTQKRETDTRARVAPSQAQKRSWFKKKEPVSETNY